MTLSIGDGLDRADVNLTDWAADDCAGRAAVQLSRFALARLHYLEEHYGLVPSAECIVGPDSSPSRNPGRLAAGYSTGGEVWWSPGRPFMPVDMLPNCCGITVGRLLGSAEPLKEYYDRLDLAAASPGAIQGHPVIVDINRKNHFAGLFRGDDEAIYVMIHCSAPELRSTSSTGLGLSWLDSPALNRITRTLETPAGPVHYVCDTDAERYMETLDEAQQFARTKREALLTRIFGQAEVLSDRQHQGYVTSSHAVLGSQLPDERSELYPFLLGPDAASWLVTLSDPAAPSQEEHSLAYLPHGAGYRYGGAFASVTVSHGVAGFTFELASGHGATFRTRSLDSIPFEYRAIEHLDRIERLGMCTRRVRLDPIATFRL